MAMAFNTLNVIEKDNPMFKSRNEQDFKVAWVREYGRFWKKVFCIETEETVAGFPDVMCIDRNNRIQLIEFKVSDRSGNVKFQPTQPAFYRKNSDLPISVVVMDMRGGVPSWIHFDVRFMMEGGLLTPRATVRLGDMMRYMDDNRLYAVNEGRCLI